MFDFLWNLSQDARISEANFASGRAQEAAADARAQAAALQRQIDALLLANMAVWSILKDKLGVSDQELADRVREIDLRDGKLDGRYTPNGQECPKCGRVMSARHKRCMYCGEESLSTKVL